MLFAHHDTGGDQVFADCPRGVAKLVAHTLQRSPLLIHRPHQPNLADRRRAIAEDDTAFSQETSEPLVSDANLSGHNFQGPARSVGGFRSLEEIFGSSQRLLWMVPPTVRPAAVDDGRKGSQ